MNKEMNKKKKERPVGQPEPPPGEPDAAAGAKTETAGRERSQEQRRRPSRRPPEGAEQSEFVEKVLAIKRVTKVTKGGKKMSFSALVVVGDGKGRVGFALEKSGEVASAIKKSLIAAKKNMVVISLKGKTIPHEIIGVHGAARVLLKPASEGTGVIASGAVRAVCDGVGIRDILTKCHRSNNPVNVVKATFDGLTSLKVVNIQPKEEKVQDAAA